MSKLAAVEPIEIVSIDGRERLAAFLEAAAVRARAGELTAVAFAGTMPDGSISTGWEFAAAGTLTHLLGAVAVLNHRILGRFED